MAAAFDDRPPEVPSHEHLDVAKVALPEEDLRTGESPRNLEKALPVHAGKENEKEEKPAEKEEEEGKEKKEKKKAKVNNTIVSG